MNNKEKESEHLLLGISRLWNMARLSLGLSIVLEQV